MKNIKEKQASFLNGIDLVIIPFIILASNWFKAEDDEHNFSGSWTYFFAGIFNFIIHTK
jgi:hypothetical protein